MRNNNRSFNRSNKRNFGYSKRKSYGGGGRSGRKQATFDPSRLILNLQADSVEEMKQEEYQNLYQFNDFAITDVLKKNIADRGYVHPTPIQDQVIPHILEGKDVVGIANTGTGKTAAFLIPLLNAILKNNEEKILIIAPTRELALQVRDELRSFSQGLQIFSTLCIGGTNINRQIQSLKRGQHFVIGTPGRIKDLNQRKKLKFEQFSKIVLDEVDRMLDMGFVHEIKNIIQALPKNRQSLFFSATMTDRVKEIMAGFLTNPVNISVKTQETSSNINQEIVRLNGQSKIEMLYELLVSKEFQKVLVFGRTKRGAERIKRELNDRGLRVNAIHGNKSQSQRQKALKQFRDDQVQALIATDVVARGLDIDNITHVINYDLPESYESYIHRIGRTGRANQKGTALTFVD